VNRGEQTLLVGWIAIAAVVLEALALAAGVVVWGAPALIVVGPVLLASVIVTVVLWLTVVPQRLLRAHLEGRLPRGAPAGWRAAQDVRGSRSGSESAASGSAWPSDSGSTADHTAHHGWHGSEGGWSGDGSTGDVTSSGSWSDSSSSSSDTSSSSSDSSSSSSSDSSSSSW
jgi:hypothetical protein